MSLNVSLADSYPRPKSIGLSREQIDTLAERAFTNLCIRPGVDLVKLVPERLGGRVLFGNEAKDGSRITVHGPRKFEIILRKDIGPHSQRMGIAHELGHYFLHAPLSDDDFKLIAYNHLSESGERKPEWEADWFASGFLMPKMDFLRVYLEKNKSVVALAATFFVSISMAETRLNYVESLDK